MTDREIELIRAGRHRARTDLLWLARNILGMSKMDDTVHQPIADFLQTFGDTQGKDVYDGRAGWRYTPLTSDPADTIRDPMPRRLILAPRSWFKTSLNVIAHSIQIILNYPDATILITHASQETAEKMFAFVKQQFQSNKTMRYFFSEFCAPLGRKDFGTQTFFNTPARKKFTTAPSISVAGIESIRTGMHYHWLKFTDIVDEKNTATKEQVEKIIHAYGMAKNLLIAPRHWIDIEGTRYHFSDLYGRIIDRWAEVEKEARSAVEQKRAIDLDLQHEYRVFVMGCYKKDLTGTGKAGDEFLPDELDLPYLKVNGNKVSRFPAEFPVDKLEQMRKDPISGGALFASQQLNNPVETDNVVFSLKDILWKTADEIKRIPVVYTQTTVDLAETVGKRSDFTTITTCVVDRMNRRYIVDIRHGKFLPDRIVDELFAVQAQWRPLKIKVEETGFARGLQSSVRRRSELTNVWPNFEFLPRDNQVSKTERILSLQPWFRQKLIYFSAAIDDHAKEQLKQELTRFPKYSKDDILDTLADQFTDEPLYGPLRENKSMAELLEYARNAMLSRHAEYIAIYGPQVTTDDNSWTGLGSL